MIQEYDTSCLAMEEWTTEKLEHPTCVMEVEGSNPA